MAKQRPAGRASAQAHSRHARGHLHTWIAIIIVFSVFSGSGLAQRAERSAVPGRENFDIRSDKSVAADEFMERYSARASSAPTASRLAEQDTGLAQLRADLPDVELNPES